jgi:hypothetical protein
VQVCSQFYFGEVHDNWLLLKKNDIRRLNTPRTDTQYHSLRKPTICHIQIWRNLLFITSRILGETYKSDPRCRKIEKIHPPLEISDFPCISEHFHVNAQVDQVKRRGSSS